MVILGVGSNWGDRLSFLRQAIQRLRALQPTIQVQAISPIYESPALLPPNAPKDWDRPFLNLDIFCHSEIESIPLLQLVKNIEIEIGRQNRGRWAPREIDIDILIRDQDSYSTPELTIPHPGLRDRPFAILPLLDLIPDWDLMDSKSPQAPDKLFFNPRTSRHSTTRSNLTLTEVVGILNLTPDSFSDGGVNQATETAVETARKWCQQGIRILDIGAESTRPGATAIKPDEECKRLEPVLEALKNDSVLKDHHLILSLDTRHPEVAKWAVNQGIQWINDVSGFEDPKMVRVAADADLGAVFMHSLSVPSKKDLCIPEGVDPIDLILKWGEKKIQSLLNQGIARKNLVFDPGLGFGKTLDQNWEIVRNFRRFHNLGVKTLVGHSRKSFLSILGQSPASTRDPETAALSIDLFEKGVDYLRVHDPVLNARTLKAWSQANGVIRCKV